MTLQIITFDRPDPYRMQYLSLTPISLTLGDRSGDSQMADEITDAEKAVERKKKQKLVEKLRLHTVVHHTRTRKETALPVILNQINCSYEINQLLQKNVGLVGLRMKRTLSVSEKFVESATDLWDYTRFGFRHVFNVYVYPVIAQMFILGLVMHRMAGEVLLRILEWRPMPDRAALKDVSATAQQVDMRLQQFCYWPIQYVTLRKRRSNWGSITNSHPEYIRFYNSLWLVANDIIIGIALGSYIIENADHVAGQVDSIVSTWFVEGLQRMISWLTDYPAGLKLNTELAQFLGDLFLWVIEYWAGELHTPFSRASFLIPFHRLHAEFTTCPTRHHPIHRILQLRRRQYACFVVLRSSLHPHHPHLRLLHSVGPHLQLAANHNYIFVPPLSG